jgi:cold shock CspA family protein
MDKIVISGKEVEEAEVEWFNPQEFFGFATVIKTGTDLFS